MRPIADGGQIEGLLDQLADKVATGTQDRSKLALIGIRRRGDVIAARLAERLKVTDVGSIDITLYRDDLSETGAAARVGKTNIPFAVQGREIVICDDVIMTGRSVMAALREVLDFGRPARVRLAVLVERPEREIPVQPDHSAIQLTPGPGEKVDVRLMPQDETDGISINDKA
jgi:pyrimidine operon attenuation protein / uracil phosphoribosyltransferase